MLGLISRRLFISQHPQAVMSNSKKRAAEPAVETKKKKKKTKVSQDDEALDMELGLNTLFNRMDNQLLADHLAQKLSRFGGDLSSVELSDLTVSGTYADLNDMRSSPSEQSTLTSCKANSIQDTTSWQETRTLDNLPGFLEKFSDGEDSLKKAPKKKGSPHTLIVAGAGLRAADIVRYGLPPCATVAHQC